MTPRLSISIARYLDSLNIFPISFITRLNIVADFLRLLGYKPSIKHTFRLYLHRHTDELRLTASSFIVIIFYSIASTNYNTIVDKSLSQIITEHVLSLVL